ncbi:MAG: VIT and VWA domain-containing protein [Verrucomicrobia bacterium]|nr:VIT and VWA domain-containing protein [Verrucomicrobiota bacterium]
MPQDQLRFGLMPVLDDTLELPRTVLPLKSIRCQFVARGGMAEVEMTQVYCQENAQPLDCEFLFPLPADGAVYRCEAMINGRIIRARIEEREAARRIIEEKKAEGRRTALVESERDNLFTLSLGNIQPQDVVEVTMAYLQPLRCLAGKVSLDIPLCPGVRYITGNTLLRSNRGAGVVDDTDQVPDASRITPPRIDAEHPDAAFIELDGQVEAGFLDGKVTSPSHKLTSKKNGDMLHITLAKGGEVPDRDLALRWNERTSPRTALRGWTSLENGDTYALLELRAPSDMEPSDAIAQDFYFLVDRSGSMQGEKFQKAIHALHGCILALNPKDRAAVTLFESTFNDFDSEPVSAAALMADSRFLKLASVGTAGGTEMEPALRHVLAQVERFSKDRPAALVLITDAEIANEQEIRVLMRRHPSLPVHCFGIDTTLNDSLLLDLVRQQGGTFHALQSKEDVAAIVTKLGRTLRQPVLVNLQVPADWELAAGAIPNLYAGQTHFVSVRPKGKIDVGTIKVLARDHQNASASLDIKLVPVKEAGPRLRWCKERLVTLMAQDDKSAAITLSKESNLLCPLTAFLAWDEQEKVAVANRRLVQPAMLADYAFDLAPQCETLPQYCLIPPDADRESIGEPLLDDEIESLKVDLASAPEDLYRDEKLVVQEHIRRLLGIRSRTPNITNCVNPILKLRDWVQTASDRDSLNLVSRLLDEIERSLEEWTHCEQRLRELTSILADELEQDASILRNTWCQQQDNRPRFQELEDILMRAVSGSLRKEITSTIRELNRIDVKIQRRIEDFLHQHANAIPTPPPHTKKERC